MPRYEVAGWLLVAAHALIEIREVDDEVVVVEARPIARGGHSRLVDDVDADDRIDADVGKPLAHHAVPGTHVERAPSS